MTTYRDAGVNLDAADELVARIGPAVTATWNESVIGGFGGFAAGIALPKGYTDPVLMMSSDGVGTKADLARRWDQLDGLGWDLVAMCVDDLAATGARPIAMTDYLAVGRLEVDRTERIVRSVAAACGAADIALLGGETAEHPGVLAADEFDLAGTALGIVERGKQIDGSAIQEGDVVVGIHSPNMRANGFSLVRRILADWPADKPLPGMLRDAADIVLEPSVLYAPLVMRLIDSVEVHGLAHITGGGLATNLARVLPPSLDADIDRSTWEVPDVFDAIASVGEVPRHEMERTFNMGVGFVAVVSSSDGTATLELVHDTSMTASAIGHVVAGDGSVALR